MRRSCQKRHARIGRKRDESVQFGGCRHRHDSFDARAGQSMRANPAVPPRPTAGHLETRRGSNRRILGELAHASLHLREPARSPGANAKQVQAWLGHHSPAFTLAVYVHLLDDDVPDASFFDAITSPSEVTRVATFVAIRPDSVPTFSPMAVQEADLAGVLWSGPSRARTCDLGIKRLASALRRRTCRGGITCKYMPFGRSVAGRFRSVSARHRDPTVIRSSHQHRPRSKVSPAGLVVSDRGPRRPSRTRSTENAEEMAGHHDGDDSDDENDDRAAMAGAPAKRCRRGTRLRARIRKSRSASRRGAAMMRSITVSGSRTELSAHDEQF